MAEQRDPIASGLTPDLYNKLRELQKFERAQYTRAGLATPATLQAALRGQNAYAVARQFFPQQPQRQGVDKLELLKMKERLLESRAKYRAQAAQAGLDAIQKLAVEKNQPSAKQQALEFALDRAKAGVDPTTRMSIERLKQGVEQQQRTLQDSLKNITDIDKSAFENGEKLRSQFESMIPAGGSEFDLWSTQFWTAVANAVGGNMTQDQQAELFSNIMGSKPGEFVQAMQKAAESGDTSAQRALTIYKNSQAGAAAIADKKQDLIDAADAEIAQTISRATAGMPGAEKLVQDAAVFEQYLGAPEGADDQALLDTAMKTAANIDPATASGPETDAFNKLLNDMDKPEEQLPANIREAKERLKRDTAFLSWMDSENMTDPEVALRELRRRSNAQRAANKMQTREVIQQRKAKEGGLLPAPMETVTTEAAKTGKTGTAAAPAAEGEASAEAKPLPIDGVAPKVDYTKGITPAVSAAMGTIRKVEEELANRLKAKQMLDTNKAPPELEEESP
jgi:hypothetical protein